MTDFLHMTFPAVLNMSLTAIPVILAVLLARLALRRAPRVFSYALWAVVLFRLLCPVSLTSGFSLLRAVDAPVVPSGSPGISTVEYVQRPAADVMPDTAPPVQPTVPEQAAPQAPAEAVTPVQPEASPVTVMDVLPWVWLAGIACITAYNILALLRLRRKLVGSLHIRENIYCSDWAQTAFVTGVLRPRIYLPSDMGAGEQTYILAHEQHHIRRGDPVWKLLAVAALTIHWFNPLVWVGFVLAARDMEMSCDEAVVRKLGEGIRADYSQSLLNLAAGHRLLTAPLAFGEGDTRSRITNVLNWKRPRTWVVVLASAACIALAAACASNPEKELEGQYASMDNYIAEQIATQPPTLTLVTWESETDGNPKDVEYPVETYQLDFLEEAGHQPDLDPKGALTVWRYSFAAKLDLGGRDPMLVGAVGGSYTDDKGIFHGPGQQVAVTRTYPDGSLDVLEDTLDIDSASFLDYHNSWDDALYDWYVRENHLEEELPLLVKDWQEQIHYPDGAYKGNYPVYRIDGDGWYFYAPSDAWTHSDGFWEDVWVSAYGTDSSLTVDRFTQSIEDEQIVCKKKGFSPVEGSKQGENWMIWDSPRSPEGVERYYFFENPEGGYWRVSIRWNPETIAAHWSEYPKMEPQVAQLMAESFTVDDRIHAPGGLNAALASIRWTRDWADLPCELGQREGDDTDVSPLERGTPGFLPDWLAARATDLQEWEETPSDKTWTFELRWKEQNQTLSFRASDTEPGVVEVEYHGGDQLGDLIQRAEFSHPELYTWLMAAREYPADGIRLVDVDEDGFLESWFYGPNLCLYDFYDGRLQQPELPTHEASFVTGDRQAALLSVKHRYHLGSWKNGEAHLYAYRDGEFTDLGTWADAKKDLLNTAEVVWQDKPLETKPDPMTYEERLEWCRSAGDPANYVWPNRVAEFDNGTLMYLQELAGTAHRDQYQIVLRFPDGTQALMPLPMADGFHVAVPEEWGRGEQDNTFVYQATISPDGSGATETYHYQVDMEQQTVTLLVER